MKKNWHSVECKFNSLSGVKSIKYCRIVDECTWMYTADSDFTSRHCTVSLPQEEKISSGAHPTAHVQCSFTVCSGAVRWRSCKKTNKLRCVTWGRMKRRAEFSHNLLFCVSNQWEHPVKLLLVGRFRIHHRETENRGTDVKWTPLCFQSKWFRCFSSASFKPTLITLKISNNKIMAIKRGNWGVHSLKRLN